MESWSLASGGKAGANSGPNTLQVVLRLQGSRIPSLLGDTASAGLGFTAWDLCRMSRAGVLQHARESLLQLGAQGST